MKTRAAAAGRNLAANDRPTKPFNKFALPVRRRSGSFYLLMQRNFSAADEDNSPGGHLAIPPLFKCRSDIFVEWHGLKQGQATAALKNVPRP